MSIQTIGFIGLGLIGGSIAKAIRRVHPDMNLIAYDANKENLMLAMADGTINQAHDTLSVGFSQCDIIFLCAPVQININILKTLGSIIKDGCILTDVGSVKSTIHKAVAQMNMEHCFIGGHPMAGSERSGFAHANDRLLENAYYILTPTASVSKEDVETLTELIRSIASLPVVLDAAHHDEITATISHLPHIIAYTLVNLVKDSDDEDERMRMLAAGGFKDITRIASSSPIMWQQICGENKENLLHILHTYIDNLNSIAGAIDAEDASKLLDFFGQAKDYRDSIPKSKAKGSIRSVYEIYVDLIDESGAIATIATILATNGISIKNIGIVHNREFQDGALRIEFYDGDSGEKAVNVLRRFHYVVHERS